MVSNLFTCFKKGELVTLGQYPPHDCLGHYTTLQAAVEGILPSNKLRFRSLRTANDPRESRDRNEGIFFGGIDGSWVPEILTEYHDANESHIKMFSLCESDQHVHPYVDHTGASYALPNMWAHYGNRHKGVCLLFNKTLLTEAVDEYDLMEGKPISYRDLFFDSVDRGDFDLLSDARKIFKDNAEECVRDHVQRKCLPDLFKKDNGWRGEQEFRYLIYDRSNPPRPYVDIDFGESLKGIVLGFEFDETYLPLFREYQAKGVPIWKLEWSIGNGSYGVRLLEPIN